MNKNNKISLLSECTSGGCGAKLGQGDLNGLLSALPVHIDERLIVGYDGADDAAAYEIDETGGENIIISTADFFSPMTDDPYIFGKIAAANALSDVYAMGGHPVMALNLACFPQNLPLSILGEILRGGAEKIKEAGASLAGGHTIYDKEVKYGLAVTGLAKKGGLLRNNTPLAGHKLILTKPLGTGIVMAAQRAGMASAAAFTAAAASMERLNKYAAEKLADFGVSACTDITGFGLAGHVLEMAGNGNTTIIIDVNALPQLPEALSYAQEYLTTAAGQRNRMHAGFSCRLDNLTAAEEELIFDPQTSGGLLIAVAENDANKLLAEIKTGDSEAAVIGYIVPRELDAVIFQKGSPA